MSLQCELAVDNPLSLGSDPEPAPAAVESAEVAVRDEQPPRVEDRLHPQHLADLRRSGLSDETILRAEIRTFTSVEKLCRKLRWSSVEEAAKLGPCIAIPFIDQDGKYTKYARCKPDNPRVSEKNGKEKKNKYESPYRLSNRLYIPPRTRAELDNPTVPLIVTEGEKKALKSDQEGFPCVGLVGVYGFAAKRKSSDTGPKRLIPDMERIAWDGRRVNVIFDSDLAENDHVQYAVRDLAATLRDRGATVYCVTLPSRPDGAKNGLDDYLLDHTPGELQSLIDSAKPIAVPEPKAIATSDRKPRGAFKKSCGDEPDNPHRLAAELLESGDPAGRPVWLRYWRDTFFEWTGSHYRKVADAVLKAAVGNFCRRQFVELQKLKMIAFQQKARDGEKPPFTTPVTIALVNNVVQALKGLCAVHDTAEAPVWLDGMTGPDPKFLLAAPNGLFDLQAAAAGRTTNAILPPDPDLFNLTAVDYRIRPDAPRAAKWLEFLSQLWPDDDDDESVRCLQEWFGYTLSGDTSHQKMLWLIGPSRAGKGTISHVLAKLVGTANVSTPGLHDLAAEFGLQSMLGKSLAIIPDGRLSNRTDAVMVTSRLLQIVGEDGLDVNRKNQTILENVRLGCRVVIAANELPALVDQSEALLNRSLVLRFTRTFARQEDTALKAKLAAELPGILLWSVEGLTRLKKNGRFTEPKASEALKEELADLLSPVGAFVRERCIVKPGESVERTDLFGEWKRWCESEGRTQPGTQEIFGRNLRAVVPDLGDRRCRKEKVRTRQYVGIRLRTDSDPDPLYPPDLDHPAPVEQRPLLGLPD